MKRRRGILWRVKPSDKWVIFLYQNLILEFSSFFFMLSDAESCKTYALIASNCLFCSDKDLYLENLPRYSGEPLDSNQAKTALRTEETVLASLNWP